MRQGGAEFRRQKAVTKAAGNWNKQYLRDTDEGFHQLKQTAMEVLDTVEWNWQCMTQLQETENRTSPASENLVHDLLETACAAAEEYSDLQQVNEILRNCIQRMKEAAEVDRQCNKHLAGAVVASSMVVFQDGFIMDTSS